MKDAEEERIEADYKAAKAKCDAMKDNAKDVCEKEAKAKEKVAKAELDAKTDPSQRNQRKVAETQGRSEHEVAKAKCDDMKGDEKNACEKQAKAKHDQAKADIKKQYAARGDKSRQPLRAPPRAAPRAAPAARRSSESMARGLWKGAISFGLVNVPVELFSAEKKSAEIDLTMLDKRDLAPVGYKRYNKSTGEDVPWAEIVKGYEYDDDKYVVLSDEDFRRANVEASKTVDIQAFVDLRDIPPIYFQTPYYLAPGKRGEKAYALLRDAMQKAGKAGIATVVIRTRQYLAAVMPQDDVLSWIRCATQTRSRASRSSACRTARCSRRSAPRKSRWRYA